MSPDTFWKMVDRAARADEPEEALRRALSRLPAAEIAAFDTLFYRYVDDAMTWTLWGAAYLAMGGCSDDGFEYMRRGLVARGRKLYERVVADADALVEIEDAEDLENEEIGYVAREVYEEKTGRPAPRVRRRSAPRGRRWDFEDARACKKRLPRLAARVSEEREAAPAPVPREPPASAKALAAGNRALFDAMVIDAWQREGTDVEAAVATYESALKLIGRDDTSPMFPLAHRNLAFHLEKRGETKRARAHIDAALRTRHRMSTESLSPYLARVEAAAAVFFRLHAPKRAKEALALARSAQRRAGIEHEVLLAALDTEIRLLLRRRRLADARRVAKRALALAPEDPDFRDVKALLGL